MITVQNTVVYNTIILIVVDIQVYVNYQITTVEFNSFITIFSKLSNLLQSVATERTQATESDTTTNENKCQEEHKDSHVYNDFGIILLL